MILAASVLALLGGGTGAVSRAPVLPPAPTLLVTQRPSGEVLVLDAAEMRLHRLQGDSLELVASFPPVECAPFQFAWEEARRRLAVFCPLRLSGRSPRGAELYLLEPGRRPRPLPWPPLQFAWSVEFRDGQLHAAGVPCPSGHCAGPHEAGKWKREQLARPQAAWWQLVHSRARWSPVRATQPYPGWRALLGDRPDATLDEGVMSASFEVSPAVFAATQSGRVWFLTGMGQAIELLAGELELLAPFPSPLPPSGKGTIGWPHRNRAREIPERRLFGSTVVGETLYLLVNADEAPQLLRLSPGGEVARQALPAETGCTAGPWYGVSGPLPCQMAVRADSLLLSPPWQEYPLKEHMRPEAP